jgi:hypothetical protein
MGSVRTSVTTSPNGKQNRAEIEHQLILHPRRTEKKTLYSDGQGNTNQAPSISSLQITTLQFFPQAEIGNGSSSIHQNMCQQQPRSIENYNPSGTLSANNPKIQERSAT